jgi:hypothetical protein
MRTAALPPEFTFYFMIVIPQSEHVTDDVVPNSYSQALPSTVALRK